MAKKKTKNKLIVDDTYVKVNLPNANLILILGIFSIISCFAYGIVGIVLGIIATKLSSKPIELYNLAPELYTKYSFKNVKSGRICATIGIALSSVSFVFILLYWVLKGTFFSIF